ncbi:hypothetical protein F2P44_29940 [Massilia sp. CCM 8695]|uniref:DUF2147 domain-containing protein n=1 Tax=Massilia frigida TaxID=2609281 RepID=A0ABX0NI01_9BURK|nr:hypothetical protein [Massilia frigida]NHZ83456.1 hypothetical protein [Massilia frigida]
MNHVRLAALVLLVAMSQASAQDVLLAGKVQRVVLLAYGAQGCPDPCEARKPQSAGTQWVCIHNGGGCESMEVQVEQVFLGEAGATTRVFKQGIGEWGPRFTSGEGRSLSIRKATAFHGRPPMCAAEKSTSNQGSCATSVT